MEIVVEMHNANAFDDDVSAYPAITVIRRGQQSRAVVASAGPKIEGVSTDSLASSLRSVNNGDPNALPNGWMTAVVETWFTDSDPWPCNSPGRLALLRQLEERFKPLESDRTETKVGIGVATGLDQVFITRDAELVESSRLLPFWRWPRTP